MSPNVAKRGTGNWREFDAEGRIRLAARGYENESPWTGDRVFQVAEEIVMYISIYKLNLCRAAPDRVLD